MMDRLRHDDSGATMVEYGLMVSLLVIVAFIGVELFGGSVRGLFESAISLFP